MFNTDQPLISSYGLISELDARVISKTLDLVNIDFPSGIINTTELGVRDGKTSRGIHDYLTNKARVNFHTGIDNNNDLDTQIPFPGCHMIYGNSSEVYVDIVDNSQHFIFIDANHSYILTMSDFLLYSDKVKPGGYIVFHDCGKQIPPMKDYQGFGSREHPDFYIACRKAVNKLGLLDNNYKGWRLIFDKADETIDTGGVVVIQKSRE